MDKRSRQGGFTLLELLVVLVIIAIVSTTSIGALRFFDDNTPEKFQEKVASLLSLGVDEAILTGKIHGLFRKGDSIYLRKYSRTNKEETTKDATTDEAGQQIKETKKKVESFLGTLLSLGGASTANSSENGSVLANDLGAFVVDTNASWLDIEVEPLTVPEAMELELLSDSGDAIDTDFFTNTSASAGSSTDEKKQEEEETLITIFWPSGLVEPSGKATILGDEKTLVVRWLTTSEVSLEN